MNNYREREINTLSVLAEGRATTQYIINETGLSEEEVGNALTQLRQVGYITEVDTGLFEITSSGREELGNNTSINPGTERRITTCTECFTLNEILDNTSAYRCIQCDALNLVDEDLIRAVGDSVADQWVAQKSLNRSQDDSSSEER